MNEGCEQSDWNKDVKREDRPSVFVVVLSP